jgi:hypothetical protein
MGFRYKKFIYTGGSGSWGSSSTPRSRAEVVIKDFAQWIIDSGTGWSLDTTRNQTINDFTEIPYWNPNNRTDYPNDNAPALFFTNSISGCKLFLCIQGIQSSVSNYYCPKIPNSNIVESSWSPRGDTSYTTTNKSLAGIIMSMIPGGSSDMFGSTFDGITDFIPLSATKLIGTAHAHGYIAFNSYPITFIKTNTSNRNYAYGLYVTPYVLGIAGHNDTIVNPVCKWADGYFVGRIFGTLAHEETLPQAKYGFIQLNRAEEGSNTEFNGMRTVVYSVGSRDVYFNSTRSFVDSITNTDWTYTSTAQFFSANGTSIEHVHNISKLRYQPATPYELSDYMCNSTTAGLSRWVPYAVGNCSIDLTTYGVIPGDGFKGYLDTDLFRASVDHEVGKLYDNGNFIGVNSMLLGWDPQNDPL